MKRRIPKLISILAIASLMSLTAFGQFSSSISGTVHDPNGAVVSGATVIVKNAATGAEFRATSSSSGIYTVPSLGSGIYIVTISAPGFKQAIVKDVKLDTGVPSTVNVTLEVGGATETVVVQGGSEIVQTQSANISTTLQVNQIAALPLISRNALDFVIFLPGTTTAGTPRNSTINGLPQGALNITIDGVNTQDNTLKTDDGFFSYISPRLDAIEEVTVSTATPGAESGGQGAVQIKFVTRRGDNDFHGSLYHYHRNPALNSNYWFNNRDTSYNVEAARPCGDPSSSTFNPNTMIAWSPDCRSPRDQVLLNQFGFRVGGPIRLPKKLFGPLGFDGRNRAFFFVNYEEFRQPTQITRTRTIFNPETQQGVFQYNRTVNNVTTIQKVNVLEVAARSNCAPAGAPPVPCTATTDPVIEKLLADIRNSTQGIGGIQQLNDPNFQRFTFANNSAGKRYYPTIRLDFNLSEKHQLENVYNYQNYLTTVDTLNGVDPAFPGFPNFGSQISNRFSESLTLRSTLTPAVVNEARFGLTGGTVLFRPELSTEMFTGDVANQAGFSLGISAAGVSNATVTTAASRRNAPVWDFSDTLSWTRGSHSLSFGGQFTQINLWAQNQTVVPSITFGVDASNDPANGMFNTGNFPGANQTTLNAAAGLYAVLTGRVTAITANAVLDEKTNQYAFLGERVQRGRQRELGVFAQDSWRTRPNLTLNYGLRWELQLPFTPLNDSYTTASVADLFGISGAGNIFNHNVRTGRATQFVQYKKGDRAYNVDYKNFAPSFGFAWSPNVKNGWLKRILGDGGQTVIRGGYSIAYNRNGMAEFSDIFGSNPGSQITATRSIGLSNLVTNQGDDRLPVLLREPHRLGRPDFPTTPAYPLTGAPFVAVTNSVNIFDPNLKVPYSQSWTFGIQREITKDMAIEVRYVGTRNLRGWTAYNLNEVNIVENGFLEEFKRAQANLQANIAAGRGNTFAFTGAPGTTPLPTYLAYFSGMVNGVKPDPNLPGSYTSSLFRNNNFINPLAANNPSPFTHASTSANAGLFGTQERRDNALEVDLAPNFFQANPGLLGGASFTGNGGYTRYDSLQTELRRRLSRGLLVQANYVFAKGFSSSRFSLRAPRANTLATGGEGYLAHAFKANWVYELPLGRGRLLFGGAGNGLERLIGGWEFHGTARIQSGQNLNFGNVRLIGMTQKELQDAFKLRFDDAAGEIFHLPQDIIDNTIRAFNVSATSPTGFSEQRGVPTGRYFAPANNGSCIQVVTGDCAPQNVYVTGPMFTRFDVSLVKRIKITENANFELRGEFLNVFNNINFLAGSNMTNFNDDDFGLVTSAYRDPNNTQDPGGRLVQIVARFNF
jgi:hypothetical protein